MTYALYQTDGLILGRKNFGEANTLFYLLTPESGLITVFAQGVRALRSKLRYELAASAEIAVTLVRGRSWWRLVGVAPTDSPLMPAPARPIWGRISLLARRLIRGEERNRELFFNLQSGFRRLTASEQSATELANQELLMVLQLLADLGYLDKQAPVLTPGGRPWQAEAVQLINRALSQSHL